MSDNIQKAYTPLKWKRWVFLAFVVWLAYFELMSWTGGCASKLRYLSDEELIGDKISFFDWDGEKNSHPQKMAELHKQNKYCCRIQRHQRWYDRNLNNKIFGSYFGTIESHLKNETEHHPFSVSFFEIDACGKPYYTYGTGETQKEYDDAVARIKKEMETKHD